MASSYLRARRFGVSASMIEQATERRLTGDWQGACATANVDVTFDLGEAGRQFGAEVADALLADLTVLAPDLVRWHLPRLRAGMDTLQTRRKVVLAGYGESAGPMLYVRTPDQLNGPQRLRLELGHIEAADRMVNWATSRYLWDASQSHELRVRCGGGDRAPFFHADGTRAELPTSDPGTTDPAARTEWLTVLQERGQLVDAFAAAGLEFAPIQPKRLGLFYGDGIEPFKRWPFVLSRVADEVGLLSAWDGRKGYAYQIDYFTGIVIDIHHDRPVVRLGGHRDSAGVAELPHVIAHRLPELDLLRARKITPDHLHPLVRASLFPALGEPKPAPRYELNPIRVRCQGVWHVITPRDGSITGPHTEQEHRREHALQALGGTPSGCFRARRAWVDGQGRLQKHLRMLRKEIFGRARHADTAGVIELLDAGVDIHVRDGEKRTLLHYIHLIDHEPLLQRLLDAGLDVTAAGHAGWTPLYLAVAEDGSTEVIKALVDAGAPIDITTPYNLRHLITRTKRTDLEFLVEKLA